MRIWLLVTLALFAAIPAGFETGARASDAAGVTAQLQQIIDAYVKERGPI